MKDHTEVKVKELPKCDFCSRRAHYDGKIMNGLWANMCDACFKHYGMGLGLGLGQKLIVEDNEDEEEN